MKTPNELVLENLYLVDIHAKKYWRRFSRFLSFEEIVAYARLGLVRAAHKFDESRGLKFSTFADWWIFSQIRWGLKKFGYEQNERFYDMRSLNKKKFDDGEEYIDSLVDEKNVDEEVVRVRELYSMIANNLNEKQRNVVDLLFVYGYNQSEVGRELGISKQAVCQIRQTVENKAKQIIE